ncbi:hypothetical protein EJ07DRAFT_161798 [Lizonia empirigonia]|nr:hypothetical protein EJ07DRAFT_161798 [Lizonia empirigonia]
MLARGALCRLAAEVPKQATHDVPTLASLVQTARTSYALPLRALPCLSQLQARAYATTKTATTPTAAAKKAVKAKAAAGKSVRTTTTAKKAAPKKAAPKKAKKKAVVKKKAKKTLTPEKQEKATLTKLRQLALKEPFGRGNISAYNAYLAGQLKGSGSGATKRLADDAKKWLDITPAEHERWNQIANERNAVKAAEYKAWIESHTPEQIRVANNARARLRKLLPPLKKGGAHRNTRTLVDERRVKRPMNPWAFFFTERCPSSDFNGIAAPERTRLIAGEWKALDANEKKGFEDKAAADKQRYDRETSAAASST